VKPQLPDPLSPDVLLSAYAAGLFPMDVDGRLHWFSPDPRAIVPLDGLHVSHTLRQVIRQNRFEVRINHGFARVLRACAERTDGTWISPDIRRAYARLHRLGFAHSVECWNGGTFAGGLYGVAIGGAFFGESMCHTQRDASKVALVALVERMNTRGFTLLDTQFITPHLARFGAIEIPRRAYLQRLQKAIGQSCRFAD